MKTQKNMAVNFNFNHPVRRTYNGLFSACYIKIIVFLILQNSFLYAISQETNTSSFEEYKKQEQARYGNYLESETKAYEDYVRQEQEAFENFKKEVEKYWGQEDFKISTNKDWVEYSDDKKQRTNVDFENGEVEVEIIISEEEANNPDLIKDELKDVVEDLVVSQGKTKDYISESEDPEPLLDEPVLSGQLQDSEGNAVDEDNADKFAEEVVGDDVIKIVKIKGEDGETRYKASIGISLAPDHIKVRAEKIEPHVNYYASRFNLPVELVYAVIHTESYFNAKARSHVPAFGLMQIVPKYAGRDAYNYLYNQDKILPANYLYQEDKNIELGVAYLKLLMTR
nr:DUF3393 domain-containing protein [Bacteroidota bacterium]